MSTDETCPNTFDGKHHYTPRRWLSRDAAGRALDPNVRSNWYEVLACVCAKRCPYEERDRVLTGLAATAAERAAQRRPPAQKPTEAVMGRLL